MFKEKINELKGLIAKKTDGNNKKNIENLFVFLVLLIITIIAINSIWGGDNNEIEEDSNDQFKQLVELTDDRLNSTISENTEYNLEKRLEDILSKISGVGKVQVLITYSETSKVVAMYNEEYKYRNTDETDSAGGIRSILESDTRRDIVFEQKNGENTPITEKVVLPKIEGAIVIAEGARDITVKSNIIQAVSAVAGVPTHKVQVFEMKELNE